ncbi:hypothetical protein DUNSADRAFT_8057 [Dunaliella salina]|uniref:Encoded protein n=1 Tax=Dunaliella salina TaxID=3046 RepID=A0ABQ7GKA2_DUNSA|nr:hypothetical protein DUNSADRAFT_8057 [Dunaliella salina]|eukprot:KAF5835000.1 hypothetical protein DUNSADRAFT_8057 [Dunaliella salina]
MRTSQPDIESASCHIADYPQPVARIPDGHGIGHRLALTLPCRCVMRNTAETIEGEDVLLCVLPVHHLPDAETSLKQSFSRSFKVEKLKTITFPGFVYGR